MRQRIKFGVRAAIGLIGAWTIGVVWIAAGLAQSPANADRTPLSQINAEYSRVTILVDKVGFGHQHAVAGKLKEGSIRLGGSSNAGRLVFDMATFAADTAEARKRLNLPGETDAGTQKQVTANMLGKDVLDVARHPTAVFEIDSATLQTAKTSQELPQYTLEGRFALHGTTRPIQVIAESVDEGNWTHLRGRFALRQSDFGIKPFSKAFGAVGVADVLTVYGDLYIAK